MFKLKVCFRIKRSINSRKQLNYSPRNSSISLLLIDLIATITTINYIETETRLIDSLDPQILSVIALQSIGDDTLHNANLAQQKK